MPIRSKVAALFLGLSAAATLARAQAKPPAAPAAKPPEVEAVALPGAPVGGVALDYIAIDRANGQLWVPAGGTGRLDAIDTRTRSVRAIENLPVREVERQGSKRTIGPSSASLGDGFVYFGNRADANVCAVETAAFKLAGCVKLPMSPDGVVYVAATHEVWVTAPRDKTVLILDVSTPGAPRLAAQLALEGEPEGYAVDGAHGVFFTNLEDRDRTLKIDIASRKVVADWPATCGSEGPRGLAIDPSAQLLVVACTDRMLVLDAGRDGRVLSSLATGGGLDNLDYLASRRLVYAAAGRAATITVARLDAKGQLAKVATRPTAAGARNAVAGDDGVAYVADGPEGRILIVDPAVR
jgi:DNA-binding beta-propeller fold protein YncE